MKNFFITLPTIFLLLSGMFGMGYGYGRWNFVVIIGFFIFVPNMYYIFTEEYEDKKIFSKENISDWTFWVTIASTGILSILLWGVGYLEGTGRGATYNLVIELYNWIGVHLI